MGKQPDVYGRIEHIMTLSSSGLKRSGTTEMSDTISSLTTTGYTAGQIPHHPLHQRQNPRQTQRKARLPLERASGGRRESRKIWSMKMSKRNPLNIH